MNWQEQKIRARALFMNWKRKKTRAWALYMNWQENQYGPEFPSGTDRENKMRARALFMKDRGKKHGPELYSNWQNKKYTGQSSLHEQTGKTKYGPELFSWTDRRFSLNCFSKDMKGEDRCARDLRPFKFLFPAIIYKRVVEKIILKKTLWKIKGGDTFAGLSSLCGGLQ